MIPIFTYFLQTLSQNPSSITIDLLLGLLLVLLFVVVILSVKFSTSFSLNYTNSALPLFEKRTAYSCLLKTRILILLLICSGTGFAQVDFNPHIGDEGYIRAKSNYEAFRDKLPPYFFNYASGGFLKNGNEPSWETMEARVWVVPVPVIITNTFDNPYSLWLCNLNYVFSNDTSSKVKNIEIKKQLVETPIEEKPLVKDSPEYIDRMKNLEPKTPEEKIQKQQYLESLQKQNPEKPSTDASFSETKNQDVKSSTVIPNIKVAEKTSAPQEVIVFKNYNNVPSFDIKSIKSNSKFINIADSFIVRMDTMGSEEAMKWLYLQQVNAGNVVYCDPLTSIPYVIGNSEKDKVAYKEVLDAYVRDFGYAIAQPNSSAARTLRASRDTYVNAYFKSPVLDEPSRSFNDRSLWKFVKYSPIKNNSNNNQNQSTTK